MIYGAIVFGVMALLMIVYFLIVRSRIAFAIQVLSAVSETISLYPATQFLAILSIFVKIGWVCLWSYTLVMVQRFQATPSYIMTAFLAFSFYWTFEVVKNIVHVSVSGTSICFGS